MTDMDIDDSLYSRQRYVLGDTAMRRLAQSSVLLMGLGGLGVEIAKNVVLAGVKSLTVLDDQTCAVTDLGSQFFIREDDINNRISRAQASAPRLAELNPYVSISVTSGSAGHLITTNQLVLYQCIIVTEASLDTLIQVNQFCRTQSPPIKFICGDVLGLFTSAFCDFGDEFVVMDVSGEEPKQSFVGHITKSDPGVVTTFDNGFHGLETGDYVVFREINGMTALNGQQHRVTVTSPCSYSLCDTTGVTYDTYLHGGITTQVHKPRTVNFRSFEEELYRPSLMTPDLCKFEAPPNLHVAYLASKTLLTASNSKVSVEQFMEQAKEEATSLHNQIELDTSLLETVAHTYTGCLPPLCAVMGGFLAQECLKSITAKFTPLSQWLHLDATELVRGVQIDNSLDFTTKNDRYDNLRECVGDSLVKKLASLRLFMVGCGAIGCEMLKNLALIGIGTQDTGQMIITDNDLIEKSNLNRQFLFRPHHIRHPKSTTAAASAKQINPDLHIDAHQFRVCPDTQSTVYTDSFFDSLHVCVNALDNVVARRYMDSRCVTNETALVETGTMGSKGHVQIIVPHVTESYVTQNDPVDEDIPYCTLKSFPATIEHCIQWARDKFESSFTLKPSLYNKFWSANPNIQSVIQRLNEDCSMDGAVQVGHMFPNKPLDWPACLTIARLKFEKYFSYRAKQLLHSFPLDSKLSDNVTLFWQSPKRPPSAVQFDITNTLHRTFLGATARLYADMEGVTYTQQEMTIEYMSGILQNLMVPEFTPSGKVIETSHDAKKPDLVGALSDDLSNVAHVITKFVQQTSPQAVCRPMTVVSFEKDNDDNGHVDFMFAAANLRASMYLIETEDRLRVKRVAGRIIPAIATTTATVAGLATIELMKVVRGCELEDYRNCFLNLALPVLLLTEPGAALRETVREGVTFTQWDKWHVHGNPEFTLANFVQHFQNHYKVDVSLVVQGVRLVYVSAMPLHNKRLPLTMLKLLRAMPNQAYTDLVVSFDGHADDDEEIPAPPIRYHFMTPPT